MKGFLIFNINSISMISKERFKLYEKILWSKPTPLYRVHKIPVPNNNIILAKEEWKSPTGSGFDRVYPYLFLLAELRGFIVPGVTPVIEASTGNAGAAFARIAKLLGYKASVIIHADAPVARIKQIKSFGANIIYSPAGQYAAGYVKLLKKVLAQDKKNEGGKLGENQKRLYCITKVMPEARLVYYTLVDEVHSQIKKHNIEHVDYFIGVVGSGASASGIGKRLKEYNQKTKVIGIEAKESPVISMLKKGKVLHQKQLSHELYGAPPFGVNERDLNIDWNVLDDIWQISTPEWQEGIKFLHEQEKKPVGRTSGAVFSAALKLARHVRNKTILILFYDPAWKYTDQYSPQHYKI